MFHTALKTVLKVSNKSISFFMFFFHNRLALCVPFILFNKNRVTYEREGNCDVFMIMQNLKSIRAGTN